MQQQISFLLADCRICRKLIVNVRELNTIPELLVMALKKNTLAC